jgi:hypothetical protein
VPAASAAQLPPVKGRIRLDAVTFRYRPEAAPVQNLVQAMASFSPPAMGQTTLPQDYRDSLAPVLAANWQ